MIYQTSMIKTTKSLCKSNVRHKILFDSIKIYLITVQRSHSNDSLYSQLPKDSLSLHHQTSFKTRVPQKLKRFCSTSLQKKKEEETKKQKPKL